MTVEELRPHVLLALVIALLAGIVILVPLPRHNALEARSRGLGAYRCEDRRQVYLGHPPLVRSPCAVSADAVYVHIPEYRDIVDQGLTDSKPRYHFLLREASRTFMRAVKAVARRHGHDVVAEPGAIVPSNAEVPEPPDRTQEVIAELDR